MRYPIRTLIPHVFLTGYFFISFGFTFGTSYLANQSNGTNQSTGINFDSQLDSLTNQILENLKVTGKAKIAVFDISDLNGKITDFGKYVAEELITRLFKTRKFEVVERRLLNKILDEHKLASKGLIDYASIKELGKILGVEAIIAGTFTDLGENVRVNLRLISTETAELFAVAAMQITKDEGIKKLLGDVVAEDTSLAVADVQKNEMDAKITKTITGLKTTIEPDQKHLELYKVPDGVKRVFFSIKSTGPFFWWFQKGKEIVGKKHHPVRSLNAEGWFYLSEGNSLFVAPSPKAKNEVELEITFKELPKR